jgi:hypothetical protein
MTVPFQVLSNLSFIKHSSIQRYITTSVIPKLFQCAELLDVMLLSAAHRENLSFYANISRGKHVILSWTAHHNK